MHYVLLLSMKQDIWQFDANTSEKCTASFIRKDVWDSMFVRNVGNHASAFTMPHIR